MKIDWKTVGSIGASAVLSLITAVINNHAREQSIEKTGEKIGKEILEHLNKEE